MQRLRWGTMGDLLQLVFEYRRLLARRDNDRLGSRGAERLDALDKLFGAEPSGVGPRGRRRHARCEVDVPATIRIQGRVHPVSVVNLGGGGLCVSPAPVLREGEPAVIRIIDQDSHSVFQYGVVAGWVSRTPARSLMGMPFHGVPRLLP